VDKQGSKHDIRSQLMKDNKT